MIKLTRLDGREFVVNAELIESFEATPETVVTLTVDRRIVVQQSVDEVLERIINYKRFVFSDWPVKKQVRLPSKTGDMFSWIEDEAMIEVDKLDPSSVEKYSTVLENE